MMSRLGEAFDKVLGKPDSFSEVILDHGLVFWPRNYCVIKVKI